jgi:lysophospholipase L1-like esterase
MLMGRSVFWYGTPVYRRHVDGSAERSALVHSLYHRRLRGSDDEHHNVRRHANVAVNYSKYFPYEPRSTYDADTGEIFRVSINGRGFRGRDVADEKAPGTLRVVTLGASSTFGYHNPDEATYPSILERIVNERCATGLRYEVINLGIPHLRSDQILSLFLAEALPLRPDVATFYEGLNDTVGDETDERPGRPRSLTKAASRWLRDHVLLALLIDEVAASWLQRFDAGQIDALGAGRPERFVENLRRLHDEARRRNILLVVGKQQARSLLVPRERLRGVTYADELAQVQAKLAREGAVDKNERNFLLHARVIAAGERWARAHEVPFVDLVAALDRDRDVLVSWVHLNPRGNRMIAEAYAEQILRRTCRPGPAGRAAPRSARD